MFFFRKIRSIEGILVGQYRLNTASIAENFKSQPALDKIFPTLPDKDARIGMYLSVVYFSV